MGTVVERSIPPQRLINVMNPAVRAMLRSPLHRVVDSSLLLLGVTGRQSGRRYEIPVGYVRLDDALLVVTQHTWRVNLRGGADVDVTCQGRRRRMRAELDEDPVSVASTIERLLRALDRRTVQRQLGLKIAGDATPTAAELEDVVRRCGLTLITLSG